ncbi:partial Lipid A export ATP-binding/permease protein MsbA, partial [Patescibacteria group bacterium]
VCQWPLMIFETIGERGRTLSGGQQQRVAIARAAIRKPDLIILDEATSALDTQTERAVQDSLNKLLDGRTAIIIAHRLSTIKDVDKIVVMKDGCIVEEGSWNELVGQDGEFAALVDAQTL